MAGVTVQRHVGPDIGRDEANTAQVAGFIVRHLICNDALAHEIRMTRHVYRKEVPEAQVLDAHPPADRRLPAVEAIVLGRMVLLEVKQGNLLAPLWVKAPPRYARV